MKTHHFQAILRSIVSVSMLLAAGVAFATTTTVNLTAQRMSTAMPDGTIVPMWGYCATPATGSCSATWAPGPTITVPYDANGTTLNIVLTNKLPVPTSLVILGQLGGGLGTVARMPSPPHATQNFTTFPSNAPASIPFTPPAQQDRARSFGSEVLAGASTTLTWNNMKPGTYIYETGTLPSLQAPMGLYGVLVVTNAPITTVKSIDTQWTIPAPTLASNLTTAQQAMSSWFTKKSSPNSTLTPNAPVGLEANTITTLTAGDAYPPLMAGAPARVPYDSDATLLFSEIDPVQNKAVDAAAIAGTDVSKRFNDATCVPNCYPAAVNYTPTYFLINGQAYDKTHPEKSTFPVAPKSLSDSGKLLVRMLNAGSRTHIPSLVGMEMSLVAEDGNMAPGNPKIQNEVLLTAGKTYDVVLTPSRVAPNPILGQPGLAYAPIIFPVFDRELSLTTANEPDGGMQGILQIAGGKLPEAVEPRAVDDTFAVPLNAAINGNVRSNDIAVMQAAIVKGNDPAKGSLAFNADGSFIYTPATGYIGKDTFTYKGNHGATNTATVTLNIASGGIKGPPVASADAYTSHIATSFKAARPGVLANDSDPSGYPLTAVVTSIGNCSAVTLNADGSFTATPATGATSCTFTYQAKNSQGTLSVLPAANVTVNFPAPSGIVLAVLDATLKTPITDYRWIIQEDLTFKVDLGVTPSPSTRTLGTSFHRSYMNVIASGCVGVISCGAGQSAAVAPQLPTQVGEVGLDPTKHYYISVLPGDAGTPVVSAGTLPGHMMGGVEVKPADILAKATVTTMVQATPLIPAQLSIYIYEDNSPTNGQYDQNETGLGGFSIILWDAAGRAGDPAGQQTYDAFNMPITNALLGQAGCPDTLNTNTNGTATSTTGNLVGVVYTCPNDPNFGTPAADPVKYALAGHALIKNITPARYDVLAHPGAARFAAGEVWWQVETLEGTPAQDAFTGIKEPVYFQEFGPPSFHTTIGFVNPQHVAKYAADNGLVGVQVTGKITNQHMSRPNDVTLWDSGSYDLLSSTTCQVALNSQGGTGPAIAIAQCDKAGNFVLNNVPAGSYQLSVWDQWLDQIIQAVAVNVGTTNVAMGNVPVLSWFTQYDQNIFLDKNKNGIYDADETGIANVLMTNRYRDGGISNQTLTDSSGNGLLAELFPLLNWYVAEADTTRFKQTGVNTIVDAGGPVDTSGTGAGLWSSLYEATPAHPAGCYRPPESPHYIGEPVCTAATTNSAVYLPGAYSYGIQSFVSQRNTINWGRAPYAQGENGGIQGIVVNSTTRPFDDQRFNIQTLWEALVPRVTVNLYQKVKLADGTDTLKLVDTTQTSSWDDWVNAVDANGKQINMQCPGQRPDDPFLLYTLAAQNPGGPVDQFRCYDGVHNWNQAQAAPYDGRYSFPSRAYVLAHPLTTAQINAGQTLVSLPPGQYVVESVTPTGFEIVKEEDKNILIGDAFVAPAVQQFGALGSIFILPDQATLNNANPNNPTVGGFQSHPNTNLGAVGTQVAMPECVGNLHRVPNYLSLFPQAQQVAPFAGMDRPLCDRKLVSLNDQMQAAANFFVFTEVPMAANGSGMILDDATAEYAVAAPDFGEKAAVPFVPVSVKDFNGHEVSRTLSDQWGAYNMMTPSSWLVNPPTPSGYGPNMQVICVNDPGPIPATNAFGQWIDVNGNVVATPAQAKQITDPQFNPDYSNFCYTLPFMPGRTTYLDTPVIPVAAFAANYNPADCAYPGGTTSTPGIPAILRVDSSAGFGPYLPSGGGTLRITALGDKQVPNPGYVGPFALTGPSSQKTITRHYGFGTTQGTVKIGAVTLPAADVTWSDSLITANVSNIPSGELVITTANGNSSVDAVTVTLEDTPPTRVQGALGGTIQAAIDAAIPGDLILVDAGTYNELVIMWKPVRLQGVGAASVIINAAKYPTTKLENWRPLINGMFAIDSATGNQVGIPQVDPLPGQVITGGVVLLEPTVLNTEEGAGITVLAKGYKVDGVTPLTGSAADCAYTSTTVAFDLVNGANTVSQPGLSNFLCAPSRIDGLSVTGGDTGGGIYVNGWAHHLEIANNRVYGNSGALHGGVRIGVPYLGNPAFPLDPVTGNPILTAAGALAGWGFDSGVKIHHNAITKNGVVEGNTGSGGAGGGVSICTGTDGYSVDHNWVCGNYSSSDGGGIGHIGFSQNGSIANNTILFNQSFQQTTSTHGGGIAVIGEPGAVSSGTGNLTIDSNLIRGNFAEAGHGGGIRLQQVNGADVQYASTLWHKVVVSNNTIDNNVAGWSGGGIAVADTVNSSMLNNTVASNDSAGIAGVLLNTVFGEGATTTSTGTGKPNPAGISYEPTSAQLIAAGTAVGGPVPKLSSLTLTDNTVWGNRSFFYKVVNGIPTLCASNNAAAAGCSPLPDQTATGQCVAGAAYWDFGVLGDLSGQPAGAGQSLTPTSAQLANVYCNGSRTTPEFPPDINPNPPNVRHLQTLQVAATVDEGNNYVNLRYGPLYVTKPTDSTGTAYIPFGFQLPAPPAPPAPVANVSASVLAFGNVLVTPPTSPVQVVTLSNTGTANLVIASIAISGTQFAYTTTCPIAGTGLAVNASCTISVTFTPILGAQSGTLSITDNAIGSPHTVALSGAGI